MTYEQRIQNLSVPAQKADVVLDTDAYNEIDDQFAIAYLLKSEKRLNAKAIYAAPFFNEKSSSPKDGMEKSYREILTLYSLMNQQVPVFQGSETYLPNEETPVPSPAAQDLVQRAGQYSPQNPLYVVAIGAITNIASAILSDRTITENIVVIWLGGHAHHYPHTKEFNMWQDIAAARVVMQSGVPLVQLPCMGVVNNFTVSKPELAFWLQKKNPLADYLAENTIQLMENQRHAGGTPWSKVIWDVTAVAWLLNDSERFMNSGIVSAKIPSYDGHYESAENEFPIRYVYEIKRDRLMTDLFQKLTE